MNSMGKRLGPIDDGWFLSSSPGRTLFKNGFWPTVTIVTNNILTLPTKEYIAKVMGALMYVMGEEVETVCQWHAQLLLSWCSTFKMPISWRLFSERCIFS